MDDCIFCKIGRHEVPSEQVYYEDDDAMAFLDIHPKAPGHTLLIPKKHFQWFEEMTDEVSDHLFRAAKVVARKMKEEGATYVQLSIVGKDVPHVHFHLIPHKGAERATHLA